MITTPGLSAGKPGATVSAADLQMDDDQLDAFVEAGHAIEIHVGRREPRADNIPDTALADLGNAPKPRTRTRRPSR